jgi:Cu(I)/Ag(I) efflux system periplasmic protein CusF
MNRFASFLAVALIAGCNASPDAPAPAANAPASAAAEPAPTASAPMAAEAKRASATGVVQSVDAAAHTVTIAHGPVEALGWPGMTMTFKAPGVDLSTTRAGDNVSFEFTSTGMDGTIEAISKN